MAVIFGRLMATVTNLVAVHAPPFDPVTVYTVVTVGVTILVLPVTAPGIQVYVVAPTAVKVEASPLQIIVGEAVAVNVIPGVTTTLTVFVPIHPELLPLTV